MKTPNLWLAGALAALLGISCNKLISITPPPISTIHDLEQLPFKSFLDSVNAVQGDVLTMTAAAVNDVLKLHGGEDSGQLEVGFAFRSSAAGAVTSLGVLLPFSGYQHTVTLWDSATQTVLAQTNVPSLNSGKWTYVSLALLNQAVVIQPNHGYVVGFNSLAVGNPINTPSPGNEIYLLDGIYFPTPDGEGKSPILPFTMGAITYEQAYNNFYDTPPSGPIFPNIGSPNNFGFPGVCDIGFIPAP